MNANGKLYSSKAPKLGMVTPIIHSSDEDNFSLGETSSSLGWIERMRMFVLRLCFQKEW